MFFLTQRLSGNCWEYIFAPGFSTAAALTEISGRGVGLDVVKAAVERVKGSISVGTEPHQGTCFRIEVPLTMAIMRSLLIESDQAIYAIALQDVRETVRVSYGELKSIHRRTALALRGEVIMVERLGELLGRAPQHEGLFDARLSILILQVKGQRFGLIVDAVLRQEEIVVKPLPDSYAGVPGLAGASILGDGNAILILDAGQLYELISGRGVASGEMQAKQDSPLLR